jgi:hypothetical protein
MSRYKVVVDDNFHYMDEDERSEHGTFATAAEALDACRRRVDESLLAEFKYGDTADELYERYASFGDDPFVVALGDAPKVEFSAHIYARERAHELTAPEIEGSKRRQAVLDRKSALIRSSS